MWGAFKRTSKSRPFHRPIKSHFSGVRGDSNLQPRLRIAVSLIYVNKFLLLDWTPGSSLLLAALPARSTWAPGSLTLARLFSNLEGACKLLEEHI